jgi:hypothetical protein
MRAKAGIFVILLIGSELCVAGVAKGGRKPAQKPQPAPPPEQQQPVVPPRPLTPEEMPATPPSVGMTNGMLTIAAENSTLGDVLNAVRHATGAVIDVPPTAGSERVVVHLGPGEPGEVIGKLLSGSKFDYIIVGSPQNATSVQRVILTARTSGPVGSANNHPNLTNQAAMGGPHQPSPDEAYQPPDDVNADLDNEEPDPGEGSPEIPEVAMPVQPQPGASGQQPAQFGQQPGQLGQQVQPRIQNQNQNQGQNQSPNAPRTPEQLLQELQRLQQQQGQQQGNQQPQDE